MESLQTQETDDWVGTIETVSLTTCYQGNQLSLTQTPVPHPVAAPECHRRGREVDKSSVQPKSLFSLMV